MLDDLKMIHQRDSQDALGIAEKQCQQYSHDYKFSWSPSRPISNVIAAGMGGSGLAAKAYKVAGGLHVPFEVVQDYDLPEYAGEDTLLVCSSYSGNTEETLSVLEQALDDKRPYPKPMIVVIASGGKLLEKAKTNNIPYVCLPAGYQPRYTFGYQYRAIAEVFAATPLVDGEIQSLETAAKWLSENINNLLPASLTKENPAKKLALELAGSSIVIYSGPQLFPAAYKWKISLNENAKQIAWCNQLPEFNHNEFLGWTSHPADKPYKVVDLRSKLEDKRTQKRFQVSEKLLSGKRPHPEVVNPKGNTSLEQLLWTVTLGDFVSLYLSLLNGLDPTPVDLIKKFKEEMAG